MIITFKTNYTGSTAFMLAYDLNNKLTSSRINGLCHGRLYKLDNYSKVFILFQYSRVQVSEEDFSKWINYCNDCGFKSNYSIDKLSPIEVNYRLLNSGKYYVVAFDLDNYINSLHLFAAITVIRMISYGPYENNCRSIINQICSLTEHRPDLSPLSVLILAHCINKESGHFIIGYDSTESYSIITIDDFNTLFCNNDRLNTIFSQYNSRPLEEVKELLIHKNYKSIIW